MTAVNQPVLPFIGSAVVKWGRFPRLVEQPTGDSVYCAATNGHGVEVKRSLLPNAGLGLFATRKYAAGDIVTEFHGHVITASQAMERLQTNPISVAHMLNLGSQAARGECLVVDASETKPGRYHGAGSFANDITMSSSSDVRKRAAASVAPFPLANGQQLSYNAQYCISNLLVAGGSERPAESNQTMRAWVVAVKKIRPGQEIFVNYGTDYWRYLAGVMATIKPRPPETKATVPPPPQSPKEPPALDVEKTKSNPKTKSPPTPRPPRSKQSVKWPRFLLTEDAKQTPSSQGMDQPQAINPTETTVLQDGPPSASTSSDMKTPSSLSTKG